MTFQSIEIAFSGQASTLAIFIVSFISSIFQASYQGQFSLDNDVATAIATHKHLARCSSSRRVLIMGRALIPLPRKL
ncbi:MAG: hypothetical protein RMY64_18435 [Nostoc sp. DedQUE08]|uniref:hypothetical protein n=1 Tax=Nostoc sp. DedQUE08 TaxID=3075393 RepID=UPI002AD3DF10|nr:hypothetical protein [Nostoc sp. DedQUE08]MDZ8067571.1 hypothetical protein [Nostoc sp. DedQUE08]